MIKFMLKYFKENKTKAIQDIIFMIGLGGFAYLLFFIIYVSFYFGVLIHNKA